jgi:alpha,alpha-trehalase
MFRFLVRRPIAAPWDAKEQRVGDLMERLLPVASALGLFAEEFDVRSTPRNLPQAFSHLALIEAAARIIVNERLGEFSYRA